MKIEITGNPSEIAAFVLQMNALIPAPKTSMTINDTGKDKLKNEAFAVPSAFLHPGT